VDSKNQKSNKMSNKVKQISAMTYDGEHWTGWSNAKGENHVKDIEIAKQLIKDNKELEWFIIDADNLVIYVSSKDYAERTIKVAKVNFNVEISLENVFVGDKFLN